MRVCDLPSCLRSHQRSWHRSQAPGQATACLLAREVPSAARRMLILLFALSAGDAPRASGGPVRKGCAVPPRRHVLWRSPRACVLGQELRARVPEHTRDVRCPSFPKEKGAREAGPLTHWGWKCGDRRLAGPTPVLPPGNWADEPQVGPLARGPWGVTRFPRGQSMLWLSGPIGLATAGQGWGRAPLLTSLCARL